ncbi:ABC transporter substrate-binding protein [Actinotalea sp. K2]|uniref:ABC transporter substrate-binding protein n=1 Tax=Actinotalea sp. K2 TaxID=2939438 RepID=UPI00201703B3|nr:PhnD/SsuA/transferrin family substrate-binding protein [Actinotalea sp. K2]MCL3859655.1 ABC transporter substrate-binding protein [Actinotalea sp. K2]
MKHVATLATGLLLVGGLLGGCSQAVPAEPSPAAPAVTATPDAQAEAAAERTTVRIASLKGPTTMGLVKLMDDAEQGRGAQDYQVSMFGTPDEVVVRVVQGEVDVALVPANLAAVLHARTRDSDGAQVAVAAINTLGMLEVLENGNTVRSIADLAGRTVYSTGKGASPEHVLNYLLVANGLDPASDLTIEYRSESTEVAALLAGQPGAVGVLPQPYATVLTTQQTSVRTALRLAEEWAAVSTDSQMVTGVVVVRTTFAEEHPEAFEDFLDDYRASTTFTNTEPALAAPLIVEAGIAPSAEVAEAAIPACNITYIEGEEMRAVLGGYLEVLFDADPASTGGSLPGDDFYHRR